MPRFVEHTVFENKRITCSFLIRGGKGEERIDFTRFSTYAGNIDESFSGQLKNRCGLLEREREGGREERLHAYLEKPDLSTEKMEKSENRKCEQSTKRVVWRGAFKAALSNCHGSSVYVEKRSAPFFYLCC